MDAFSFVPRKDASKLKLRTFWGKDSSKSLVYWYDFGDDWIHTIKLEAVSDEALLHARCLAGKGTCPPEDCGGVPGYEYMKGLLEEDPESEEAQEMREWLGLEDGETWDANYFNLEAAQNMMPCAGTCCIDSVLGNYLISLMASTRRVKSSGNTSPMFPMRKVSA